MTTIRRFRLPGFICEDVVEGSDWSYLWYCSHCGQVYATILSQTDQGLSAYKAREGCCSLCKPSNLQTPGRLNPHNFDLDWPDEVLRYELECELRFLESPYYEKGFL